MADVSHLKQMIHAFRVSELHLLLAFAGRNKNGRKTELQQRAIDLLTLKSDIINHKVENLYKSLQVQLQHNPLGAAAPVSESNSPADKPADPTMQPQPHRSYPNYANHRPGTMFAPNAYPQYPPVPKSQSQFPVHPDVKLKVLPFYDICAELLKPSSLVPQGNQRQQESSFLFHLTPQQASDISTSRDTRPGVRAEYTTQVQLRFCLLETTSEQEDCFPPGLVVKVNGKICPLPNPIPTNKQGVEPKRPPRALNVTANVKLSPVVANSVQVQWSTDYTRGYVLAIYLVNKKSSEDLLSRLKQKGVRVADFTRGMIKEKLREDADSEIATTSLRVSLVCPLGKMRMMTPCRASTCQHFQCFDASLYLLMNEKKATWMCPVCDKPALYDKLVIDGYFQEVLASNVLPSDSNEIQLNMDGGWTPHLTKKEQSCVVEKPDIAAEVKPETKVEAVEDARAAAPNKKVNESEVVTLSDSDDEPSVPVKRNMPDIVCQVPAVNNEPQAKGAERSNSPSLIILDDSPVNSPGPPQTAAPPPAYGSQGYSVPAPHPQFVNMDGMYMYPQM